MKTIQITISAFFFVCLFNVAFIPKLCLNAVEDLQKTEVNNNIVGEESSSCGLNIFEEESKKSTNETNEEENNNLHLKDFGVFRTSTINPVNETLIKNIFHLHFYQSISILKITPPPKV
ncbi:hypothetical protein [Marivirga sp.]|uniref:hypothetical protein n=1 Tax=Marivirga sp. TaxID=2018662 RepID=UPI002D7FAD02|nr:hypothetical protein [Marivirga sp.]HET8859369.1 hypothetical protein [Marivirga sp.]